MKLFSQRPWYLAILINAANSTKLFLFIANSTFFGSPWAYAFLPTHQSWTWLIYSIFTTWEGGPHYAISIPIPFITIEDGHLMFLLAICLWKLSSFSFFKEIHVLLFIYLWLCWVFVSVRGLSLVAASGDHSSLWCAGLSLSRPLLLGSTGSRRAGSVIAAHGPSCSVACGIFPDQGSNPCPLHWQADSQPLRHQGSPWVLFLIALL